MSSRSILVAGSAAVMRRTGGVSNKVHFSSTSAYPDQPLTYKTPAEARAKAFSLYRQLLRGGKKMPTPNRQNFVIDKTRSEYRDNMHLTDAKEIDFCLRLADTNVDTVMVQAEHLTGLFNDPAYRFRDEI
jgi:hypothetical protein